MDPPSGKGTWGTGHLELKPGTEASLNLCTALPTATCPPVTPGAERPAERGWGT